MASRRMSREERRAARRERRDRRKGYGLDPDIALVFDTEESYMEDKGIRLSQGPTAKRLHRIAQNRRIARVLASISVIFALFIGTTVGYSAWNAAKDRKAGEVPAFHTRYEALGSQIVSNYLQQLPPPNVMMTKDVKWPAYNKVTASESDPSAFQKQGQANSDKIPTISGVTLDYGERYPMPLQRTSQLPDIQTAAGVSMVDAFSGDTTEEVLRYYVIMNGQPVMVNVDLLAPPKTDYKTVPVLLSAPTITEVPRGSEQGNSVSVKSSPAGRDGYLTYKETQGLTDAISRFAVAWAKNDQGTLKLLTRDTSNKQYSGLGGWESKGDAKVLWGAQTSEMKSNDQAIVQATFTITQTVEKDSNDGDKTVSSDFDNVQTMDFLIGNASSDSPAILAWGAAGTWPDLKPGDNAISGEQDIQEPGQELGGDKNSTSGSSHSSSHHSSSSSSGSSSGSHSSGFTGDTFSKSSRGSGSETSSSSSSRSDSFDAPPVEDGSSSSSSPSGTATSGSDKCTQLGIC